jgi:hypothetical protein
MKLQGQKGREFKMLKMKKKYTLLLFLLFYGYFCHAQPPGDDGNRIEVIKMAYITRELNLTPQEAQNFWPVYNNYVNEIKQARSQYPDDEIAFEKKVVEIKERYQGDFKRVLGNDNQRVNKVYTTERQFNNTLRSELKNRQQKQQNYQQSQQNQLQQPKSNGNNPNNDNNVKRENGNAKRPHPPL